MCKIFLPFKGCIISRWIYTPGFVDAVTFTGYQGCLHLLAIVNDAAMNTAAAPFSGAYKFQFLYILVNNYFLLFFFSPPVVAIQMAFTCHFFLFFLVDCFVLTHFDLSIFFAVYYIYCIYHRDFV